MNEFATQLQNLQREVDRLRSSSRQPVTTDQSPFNSSVGLGGPYQQRTSNFGWVQGPYRGLVDSGNDLNVDILVPTWVTKLLACNLRIVPRKTRGVASGAPSGTTNAAVAHSHIWGTFEATTASAGSSRRFHDGAADDFYLNTVSATSRETEAQSESLVAMASAAHTHNPSGAIQEGSADATDIHLLLDSFDFSTFLGGPWTATAVVSLLPILVTGPNQIDTGYHTLTFQSSALGMIEFTIEWYVIARPVAAP